MSRTTTLACITLLALCGCDNRSGTGIDSGTTRDTGTAMQDTGPGLDTGSGLVQLTVRNYLAWCSVSVNGGTASTASEQTVNVAPGVINLSATPAPSGVGTSNFILGLWHDTDGDSGAGETGNVTGSGPTAVSTTTETVVAGTPGCIWICCPFTNGTGCEPSTTGDLCP